MSYKVTRYVCRNLVPRSLIYNIDLFTLVNLCWAMISFSDLYHRSLSVLFCIVICISLYIHVYTKSISLVSIEDISLPLNLYCENF